MTVAAVAACANEQTAVSTDNGHISVDVTVDARIAMADGSVFTVPDTSLPVTQDLSLTLTAADGKSHTWPQLRQYDDSESFLSGAYTVTVDNGAMRPRMGGSAQVIVTGGQRTTAAITCAVQDALIRATVTDTGNGMLRGIRVHSPGDGYPEVFANISNDIYINGGTQSYYAVLSRDNDTIVLELPVSTSVAAAHGTLCTFEQEGNVITADVGGKQTAVDVPDNIFDAEAPVITAYGFTPGGVLTVEEGITLRQPVTMTVTSGRALQALTLTTVSPAVSLLDLPEDIDLLHPTDEIRQMLDAADFRMSSNDDNTRIVLDFTGVLETMASLFSSTSTFTIMARDKAGVCSQPTTLAVSTHPVSFTVPGITGAAIGVNRATVTLESNNSNIERSDVSISTDTGIPCPIVDWHNSGNGQVAVTFVVPEGDATVSATISYLGLPRANVNVMRTAPDFGILVDPYATVAEVRIAVDNDSVRRAVTRYSNITINGIRAPVVGRNFDNGAIYVTGLTPDKKYTVGAEVAGVTKTANFKTEKATSPPHGSFAEWRVSIDDKKLPSGGRYSTSDVSIVNRQNYQDVYVQWPQESWANNNEKTYYKGSLNRNTWYMQPSAKIVNRGEGDTKAIMLASVGWDHDGEAIPDYVQMAGEYVPYSRNIPKVTHRSAGRLWLGSYSYNADTYTEEIRQGVPFTSRPSALNGYFRYIPDIQTINDQGYVQVRLVHREGGQETTVAEGYMEFATTPDYRTFSVPLSYVHYGLLPTHLCIMFCSTTQTGTQAYEDSHVPVTALPELGIMRGSTLWVSQLTFSY